jgi:hypothetical protein
VSEIMPIPPSPPLPGVQKIETDKQRKKPTAKRQSKEDASLNRQAPNDQPAQHIDEIV